MKKKLGIIIAILLCAVLLFTFAACGNKSDTTSTDSGTKDSTKDKSSSATVAQAKADDKKAEIEAFIDSWLLTHAEEEVTNQQVLLKKDLTDQGYDLMDSKNKAAKPTINITFKDDSYKIEFSWTKGSAKLTFEKEAKTVTYTHWAGKNSRASEYKLLEDDEAASETLDTIVMALLRTVNKVTGNAVTGKFGVNGVLGIEVVDQSYGLRVKGNVDTDSAANTEVGLVLVDENLNELGGIYYDGAATAAGSRLYLQYSTKGADGKLKRENGKIVYNYRYIDYADILGYVKLILPEVKAQADAGVLPTKTKSGADVESLADLLDAFGAGDIAPFVGGVVDMIAQAYEKDGRYLIDINLGSVMAQVSDIMTSLGADFDLSSVPIIGGLGIELATMHGLLGHVSISAKVKEEGTGNNKTTYLTDFELALNIPECTFYYTADETDPAKKLDIPSISFAIYLNDFSFVTSAETPIANVIPEEAATKATYFSPTNVDLSGDVYVYHDDGDEEHPLIDDSFHFDFVTDINPLEIIDLQANNTARAALVIKQSGVKGETFVDTNEHPATNFLSISYEQESRLFCVSGTVFDLEDDGERVYTYTIVDGDTFYDDLKAWLDYGNSLTFNEETGEFELGEDAYDSATAVFGSELTQKLIKYFMDKKAEATEKQEEELAPAFSFDSLEDYYDAFKALYNDFVEEGVIAIDTDAVSAGIHVTPAVINRVTALINDLFDAEIPEVDDPEYVNVEFNTEGYEDKCYISVKFDGTVYELTFDNSKAEEFSISFKMATGEKIYEIGFKVEGLDEDKWSATGSVVVKNAAGIPQNTTRVTLSEFVGEWGEYTADRIEALLPTAEQKADAGEIFPSTNIPSPATAFVTGVMGLLESEAETVEKIGQFVIRQVVSFLYE